MQLKPSSPAEKPHVYIVLGKGGVGKSTTAIALSLKLSKEGKTLLVSFDPAKHLLKYLDLPGPGTICQKGSIHVYQFDLEGAVRRLSEELRSSLEDLLPSLKVLNVEGVLRVARYTPGLEEDAIIRELSRLYRLQEYDYLVVDTPPTGIALRVLVLPELYTEWLNGLVDIRLRVLSLKYTIERVRKGRGEIHDQVLEKLLELRNMYSSLRDSLRNSMRTSFIIVANPEPLPFYEMKEITRALSENLGVKPSLLVMNKIAEEVLKHSPASLEILREYCNMPAQHLCLPLLKNPPSTLKDVEALWEKAFNCCRNTVPG